MILNAAHVVKLQHFLMDAARHDVIANGASCVRSEELLASAAALDYALLMSVRCAAELLDDEAPAVSSVRETMARAANAALDVVAVMLHDPDAAFDGFTVPDSIFTLLRELLDGDVVRSNDVAFRRLTLASEASDRRPR
ncbi:MAG: hypothetical protein M3R53_00105 [Candidatus Eremiobacteraeota bacterium]|nr:hypothetical protein [Candidatus Eremiobacteraeota bacterium]